MAPPPQVWVTVPPLRHRVLRLLRRHPQAVVGAVLSLAALTCAATGALGAARSLLVVLLLWPAYRFRRWPVPLATCAAGAAASVELGPVGGWAGVVGWTVVTVGVPVAVHLLARVLRDRGHLRGQLSAAQRERELRELQMAAEREQLTAELQFGVTHDPLTGLPNRTSFTDTVAAALARDSSCGVLLVSLAEFTGVNSTYGPSVGDRLLVAAARRIEGALRAGDVVARVGGDEFGVVLHGLPAENAPSAGDRVLAALADPFSLDAHAIVLPARAGLAVGSRRDGVDAMELLRRADIAMSGASAHGSVVVYSDDAQHEVVTRTRLTTDLRRAIGAQEFFCVYQPIVSTQTGRVSAVETLVRWQHPERGLVPPDQFIGAAERSGLIVPLGLWVLEHACRQLRAWTKTGTEDLGLAVNLSARQLYEPDAANTIGRAIWRAGVDPRHVVLEITESLLLEDPDAAVRMLWQLRTIGVRLALDDFGTGYSSLSRLDEMPLDEMKIDKSFVDRIGAQQRDSSAIVAGTVAIGHALGLTVVAEGVETEAQAGFLTSVGCDLLQGYLLGRPQTSEFVPPQLGRPLFDIEGCLAQVPRQRQHEPLVPRVVPALGAGR